MTAINRKDDPITLLNKMDTRLKRVERTSKYDDENDNAPLPPSVTLTIELKEHKVKAEYRGRVQWGTVSANTCQADVDHWVIEMRPCTAAGNPVDLITSPAGSSENDYKRHRYLRNKAQDVPHMIFENLEWTGSKGGSGYTKWYWQARVAIVDKAHRLGPFSSWTTPTFPPTSAHPAVPVPTGMIASFDTFEKNRWQRVRAIVEWDEITDWDVPGGDKEPDVARYIVEMQLCDSGGSPLSTYVRKHVVEALDSDTDTRNHAVFARHITKWDYYRFRVRAVDRFNRKSAWTSWTAATQAIDNTAPPVPSNVDVWSEQDRIAITWDDPIETNDNELMDLRVAHYQVQTANDKAFTSIVFFDRYVAGNRRQYNTETYKRGYFMRVRSVDASGNKSAWRPQTASQVLTKPHKGKGSRRTINGKPEQPDVDWNNDKIGNLAGGLSNRGYMVSATTDAHAFIDPNDDINGTIIANITVSPTFQRVKAGIVFRRIDANNFLMVNLKSTSSGNGTFLQKRDAGTYSTLTSVASPLIENDHTYELTVVLNNNVITVIVDGITLITYTLAGANATKFGTGTTTTTGYGIYKDVGAASDDGKSRFEDIVFTNTSDEAVIDDDFDRTPSTTSLGDAASGQTWTAASGTWGIETTDQPWAMYGYALTMPVFEWEDNAVYTGQSITNTTPPATFGLSGKFTAGQTLVIDRPTKLLFWAFANWSNESATVAYNMRMYIVIEDQANTGTFFIGRQVNSYSPISDQGNHRLLGNIRQFFIDGSYAAPVTIQVFWGYMNDTAQARNATIRNQKMICMLSYAPDLDPTDAQAGGNGGTTQTARVPLWTRSQKMRNAYRRGESNS